MQGRLQAVLVSLVAGVLIAGVFMALGRGRACGPGVPPEASVVFSRPMIDGESWQNTSDIWVAHVSGVARAEPFDAYRAQLKAEGRTLVDPVRLHPGLLGVSGRLEFEFFDYGTQCLPTPCPPPEGPDGLLNANDYFRLSSVDAGVFYQVVVLWAETGEVVGLITIHT
jgi:hypothetical protein